MIKRPESIDDAVASTFFAIFDAQELEDEQISNIIELIMDKDLSPKEKEYVWEKWLSLSKTLFEIGPDET